MLYQYKDKLSSLPTEILRGIVYEFLSLYEVDNKESSFSKKIRQSNIYKRVEFTNLTLELRDKAILRHHYNHQKRKERLAELRDLSDTSIK